MLAAGGLLLLTSAPFCSVDAAQPRAVPAKPSAAGANVQSAGKPAAPAADRWAAPASPRATAAGPAIPISADPTAVINQVVARHWAAEKVTPAPFCDDATFARRIYLDLAGRIPTPEEVDAFVAACRAERAAAPKRPTSRTVGLKPRAKAAAPAPEPAMTARAALVDRLLASPDYAERMRDVFDVVFMGRGKGPAGGRRRRGNAAEAQNLRAEWLAYLERGFAENRPWNRTLADLALARPSDPKDRGAIWFLYARNNRYQEIAETVSASMLGVQVQCAQCHNHFLVPEIKQKDYWGLVAFFNRSKNQDTKEGPRVAESAIGGFSNFATLQGESFPAELTFFDARVPEMRPAPNMMEKDLPTLYRAAPAVPVNEPPVPLFSRREQFVEKVLKSNPLVARAAVNRFWELLMGRGIVHPVDRMDSTRPPSHPELLDWLAKDFERSGYNVKRLVRAIVLSRPYQLEARRTGVVRPELFAYGLEKPLTAEQLYRSLMIATTGKTDTENGELQKALTEVFPDVFVDESVSTLRQAMFLTNNPIIQKLAEPTPGTTAERLLTLSDPAARVREAFRVAFARAPDAAELRAGTAYLTARADRTPQATKQLWWALLSGAEFRFNH